MGVDFYTCPICKEGYPDCGYYFECYQCGISICESCARTYKAGKYSELDSQDEDSRGCPFCSLQFIHTIDLLHFCMDKLGIDTREQLEEKYREDKHKNNEHNI